MNCIICSTSLPKMTKSGTCSRKCNAIYQNKRKSEIFVQPLCRQCQKPVGKNSNRRVFCSVGCQHLWWQGENHYRWNGGRKKHSEGYAYIKAPDHPFKDSEGYILEHRLIAEDFLVLTEPTSSLLVTVDGVLRLRRDSVIHHKNHQKDDNRPSNLEILASQSEHMRIDNPQHRQNV